MEGYIGMKTIVTHNGKFHADDVFAVASLLMLPECKGAQIIRTRDTDIIESGDYVVDVGFMHDPGRRRFDHHQQGRAGKRENGICYAAFGLVWGTYGEIICGDKEVAKMVEQKYVQPIDASDNGQEIYSTLYDDLHPFLIEHLIDSFNPTWDADSTPNDFDNSFLEAVDIASIVLTNLISRTKSKIHARSIFMSVYSEAPNKEVLVFDKYVPVIGFATECPEPLYLIRPDLQKGRWSARAVLVDKKGYDTRSRFPKEWGGLLPEELQKISGVQDAVFCHIDGFLAIAGSKNGVLEMVKKAIESTS